MLKALPELGIFSPNAVLWFEQPYEFEDQIFYPTAKTAERYPFLAGKCFTPNQIDTLKVRAVVLTFPFSLIECKHNVSTHTELIR